MNRKYLGMGLPTIITIFVVLCLTCFSTISYLHANSALKRARTYGERIREYYDAENKAVDTLNKITKGNLLGVEVKGNHFFYRVTINEKAYLAVELEMVEGKIEVRRWQMISGTDEKYGTMRFDV